MIVLYQFPPAWDLPNISPFCMKVETYLRMVKVPFRLENVLDPRKAPKGKLPYITDGDATVADSGFIVDYMKQKYGDPLDEKLGRAERALGHSIRRMIEEHLYFCAVYDRWLVDKNWELTREAFLNELPFMVRQVAARSIQEHMRKRVVRQGVGAHTADEVYALAASDISALSDLLGDKPFFLGAEPSSLDASAYAFIANVLWAPIDSPMSRHLRAQPNLVGYCDRMKARYYA